MVFNGVRQTSPLDPLDSFTPLQHVIFFDVTNHWIVTTPLVLYLHYNTNYSIQDMLICIEMVALSLVHMYAFKPKPYKVVWYILPTYLYCYGKKFILILRHLISRLINHPGWEYCPTLRQFP